MTLLVFGKTGQVSTELSRLSDATCMDRSKADLSNPSACADIIRTTCPRAVINAAAYTAVDRAEEEEDLATIINGDTPGAMATACAELGIPFVHISTDYVFDGRGETPFAPDAAANPLGAYGRSKLKGEVLVRASGSTDVKRHLVLRDKATPSFTRLVRWEASVGLRPPGTSQRTSRKFSRSGVLFCQ